MSVEEWKRLPLPGDYKNPILIGLLENFPKLQPQVLSIFDIEKSKLKSLKDMHNSSALSDFGKFLLKINFFFCKKFN